MHGNFLDSCDLGWWMSGVPYFRPFYLYYFWCKLIRSNTLVTMHHTIDPLPLPLFVPANRCFLVCPNHDTIPWAFPPNLIPLIKSRAPLPNSVPSRQIRIIEPCTI